MRFNFYCRFEKQNDSKICECLIYTGEPHTLYFGDLFSYGKWKKSNEFILTGKAKEVEFCINLAEKKLTIKNISGRYRPPIYELNRFGADKEKAWENYLYPLPPDDTSYIIKEQNIFDS